MINKLAVLKCALAVVFFLAIAASLVGSNEEAEIISQRQFLSTPSADKPVTIKGRIYYISDHELFLYQSGRYGFFAGCLVVFFLIGAVKKFDKDGK